MKTKRKKKPIAPKPIKPALVLDYDTLQYMLQYFTACADAFKKHNQSYISKCTAYTLADLIQKKLYPHTLFRFDGDLKITLSKSNACAVVACYQTYTPNLSTYELNKLRELAIIIDKQI